MFAATEHRESLRDLIVALEAHRAKQYHLGLGRNTIVRATLAYAKQTRDYRIFEDFAFYMMKEACKKRETNILIYQERSMLLIRQLFRCVLQLFHGQSSEVRKEESKHMSYMT